MTGWLPLVMQFVALGGIAFFLARLATRSRRDFAAAFPLALGLMWSISQFENLSWAFQTCFPLVHLFEICAVIAFARALETTAWWRWLVIACAADALATFSLGSGLFVIAPVLCVAIWMDRLGRQLLIFAVFHIVLAAIYLAGGVPTSTFGKGALFNAGLADHVAQFLGASFGGWALPEIAAGYIGFIALMAAFGAATYHLVTDHRPLERNSAILLSVAVFVLAEAAATSVGRASMGFGPRYATASAVFECALLGFYFRQCVGTTATLAVGTVAMVAVIGANGVRPEADWAKKTAMIDRATEEFRAGQFDPATIAFLWPGLRREWLDRYVALRIGPYRSVAASPPAAAP
jgi:hypothetical protein